MTETATLVDSHVVLDAVREDPIWSDWSEDALARAADEGSLLVKRDRVRGGLRRLRHRGGGRGSAGPAVFLRAELPWPAAFLEIIAPQ